MKPLTKTQMEIQLKVMYDFMKDCKQAEIAYGNEVDDCHRKDFHFARADVFGFVIEYCNVYFRPLV